MESAFASASAISDQRQKIEQYKNILSYVIASNDIAQAKKFIDHINTFDTSLECQFYRSCAVGGLAAAFTDVGAGVGEVAHYILNQIELRVVSFEEQVRF
ncbi:unnamed protein product [Ilex paraguariensis]|uniref:Uncharacterized protein n=1 Tax=Ilex paraguariensis TaxID=185542 RepID=A0ABC8V529_9AQUA